MGEEVFVLVPARASIASLSSEDTAMKTMCLLSILVILACFGCSHPTQPIEQTGTPLDASVNGKRVIYPDGQSFVLDLDLNADAGYTWDYTISEPAVVMLNHTPTTRQKDSGPVVPGGMAVETFYFRTAGYGESTVILIEHQAWLKDVPPLVTVEFTVVVR